MNWQIVLVYTKQCTMRRRTLNTSVSAISGETIQLAVQWRRNKDADDEVSKQQLNLIPQAAIALQSGSDIHTHLNDT